MFVGFILFFTFVTIYGSYRWFRKKLRVAVKCWFCGGTSRVIYDSKNSWDCPSCEQYNGFTNDGDFNKEIPEMHDERLNRCVETTTIEKIQPKPDVISLISPNGLCHQCNQNQLLKVRQLANFVPSCEDKFDEEIESYRSRLEQIYALCFRCRTFVNNELSYQNQKFGLSNSLISSHLKRLHPKSVATFVTNASKNTLATSKTIWKQKRRSVGAKSAVLMLLSSSIVGALWFSDLHNVQSDSQTELIVLSNFFPFVFVKILPKFYSYSSTACVFGMIIHSLMIYFCKARRLMTDYIGILLFVVDFVFHTIDVRRWTNFFDGKEDLYVLQFCTSTVLTMVVVWSCVLPRRRTKRPSGRKCNSSPNQSTLSDSGWSQLSSKSSKTTTPTSTGKKFTNMKQFLPTERVSSPPSLWRQDLPDAFAGRHREGSPSRVLGAKLSTLSLRSTSPTKSNYSSAASFAASPSFQMNNSENNLRSRQKVNGSILAPPKFTIAPTSPSATNLWSAPGVGMKSNEPLQFWWNRNEFSAPNVYKTNSVVGPSPSAFAQPDEDTVSLLSGFSAATSKRIISPQRGTHSSTTAAAVVATKGGDSFWKIVVGFVLVFSLSTNLAVLYHVFVKN